MCMYAFYDLPGSTLNLFVKSYGTTGNTLRLWHYVRRDGGCSVYNRLNISFGIPALGVSGSLGNDGALFFHEWALTDYRPQPQV